MEKNKDTGHSVRINILKKVVNNAIVKELINISKKTNINGFRKGKIPIKVVKEKYGDVIYYDVFKQLMQKFFYEFTEKEKIKIIGSPKYYLHKNEDNKKEYFEYSVIYEIYPKFNIEDIKSIKAKNITVNITDADIKKNIEKYKTRINVWNIENKAIKPHDRVTINYNIYEKNKRLKNFETKNFTFIVSENTLIPQLNEKIINHIINDIIFFKKKFHPFYPEKELQNKDITFKIKIVKIEKKREQDLEEKNIKNEKITQVTYQTIKNNFIFQVNKITEKYLEEQIIKNIIKKNIILIPPILFQEEIKCIYEQYKKEYLEEKNHNILEKKYHINFDFQARKRLSLKIIIEKIISDHQLHANENNVKSLIKNISLNYKKPIEIINLYNKDNHLKNKINNIDLENQAVSLLKKNIQTTEEYWTFDKFINYNWKMHDEFIV